jgi:signal transduction histidine kinase
MLFEALPPLRPRMRFDYYCSRMTRLKGHSWLSLCVVGTLVAILCVLGVLQYRWAGVVSEANRDKMQASLRGSLSQIRLRFNEELLQVSDSLQPGDLLNTPASWQRYANRYRAWRDSSRTPDLVGAIYVFRPGESGATATLHWNIETREFEAAQSPQIDALAARLTKISELGFGFHDIRKDPFVWELEDGSPVVIDPLTCCSDRPHSTGGQLVARGYLLLQLRLPAIRDFMLPELIRREMMNATSGYHNTTLDYHVAVLDSRNPGGLIYGSIPGLVADTFSAVDQTLLLLGRGDSLSGIPELRDSALPGTRGGGFACWSLVAKHRQGSVDAVIAAVRRRCLAINFGILLVLAAAVATILMSGLRAQRFLQLQMEFVAGVSHELRSPLAVISSAADNLADGLVRSEAATREYGSLLRTECRRLSTLVEHTLSFAAERVGRRRQDPKVIRVADVIDRATREMRAVHENTDVQVETVVEPDLPMLLADDQLLAESLLNLINNALKYSAGERWLAIRARTATNGHGPEVQITVEDHGIGIEEADLQHIFEPFYRGRAPRVAQVSGTGLGLSLAHETIAAMGGRITVKSTFGQGSAFTIHMPVWQQPKEAPTPAGAVT